MKKKVSFWKGVGYMFKILGFLVVVALLAPVSYFAWRASQPMSMPEFGGRSYYQLLAERRQAYNTLAIEYQTNHPNVTVKSWTCFFSEISVELLAIPNSGFYTLAAIYPDLQTKIDPRDIQNGYIPKNANWVNFLPKWWLVFEKFIWGTVIYIPHGPVPYCRITSS
jgi:hypothetical protein